MRKFLWAGAAATAAAVAVVAALVLALLIPAAAGLGNAPSSAQDGPKCPDVVVAAAGTSEIVAAIVAVGTQMGVSPRGQMIALATGLVESGLRNLDYGDRDSLGVFQQRPSQGWGTIAQIMDVTYSAGKFYTALLAVPGWENLEPGSAAQAVQRSAFPSRYAEQMGKAAGLLNGAGAVCVDKVSAAGGFTDGAGSPIPRANPRSVADAIAWARAEASSGRGSWYRRCLAFVAVAYGWGFSGVNYAIDHFGAVPAQYRHPGDRNPPPGALLYWTTGSRAGHIALYLGGPGGLIASNDILTPGQISVVPASMPESEWGARYVGWTENYFPQAG